MRDPYTDLEINAPQPALDPGGLPARQPRRDDRLREHAPDLRPPATCRWTKPPDRAGRRERDQQDGRRVVPPPLRRRLRAARRRPAADEHLRARGCGCATRGRPSSASGSGSRSPARRSRSSATAPAARLHLRRRRGRRLPAAPRAATRQRGASTTSAADEHVSLLELAELLVERTAAGLPAGPVPRRPQGDRHRRLLRRLRRDRAGARLAARGPAARGARRDARVLPRARRHYWATR